MRARFGAAVAELRHHGQLLPAGRVSPLVGWLGDRSEAFHIVQGVIFALSGGMALAFFWLRYAPAPVHWTRSGARVAIAAAGGAQPLPKSARLPAKGNELHGAPGRGWPRRR